MLRRSPLLVLPSNQTDGNNILLTLTLSVFLGILSVINKFLLYLRIPSGWVSGMAIGILSSYYFYSIGLPIIAISEFGFFLVMLYGFIFDRKLTKNIEAWINAILTIITAILLISLFEGLLQVFEFISAASFIWGGYALSTTWRRIGWLLLINAHLATSLASNEKGQLVFSLLQLISAAVCIWAMLVPQKPAPFELDVEPST